MPQGEPEPDRSARRGLSTGSIRRGTAARVAIRALRGLGALIWQAFEILLAVIILFEEWGWRPLASLLARLARFPLVARLEGLVRKLGPWPSLAVFLVPWALFMPLKLASFWLIAHGQIIAATVLFAVAKVAGTALYARIFQLTQPALMQLSWFRRAYEWFMPWKDAIMAHARATRAWQVAVAWKLRLKSVVSELAARLTPVGRALIARLRAALGR